MSGYGSLFERLANEIVSRDGLKHEACITRSVAAHLAKMLSIRAGSVQTLPDYGLPDLNDMNLSLHDALIQARGAIENFICMYEPRLSEIKVVAEAQGSDRLRLSFAIEGLLNVDGMRRPVKFFASLDGAGQVSVH
jgi:type VI secretion system protein